MQLKSSVTVLVCSLLVSCSDNSIRFCNQKYIDVLYAIALGDTVFLDSFLLATKTYDFTCYQSVILAGSGDSMLRELRYTKYSSVYRTYFKYPIPQSIIDELLYWRSSETIDKEFIHILLRHKATLEYISTHCSVNRTTHFLGTLDTWGYDFNWISPATGNNALMDFCYCNDIPEPFQQDRDDVIRFLVQKGVPVDVKNHKGETAIDIAKRTGLIGLLREEEKND